MMAVMRFDIVAKADPQILTRLLSYFAQLGMLPGFVNSVLADQTVAVRIEQSGLSEHQARVVAERMRSSVLVETVLLHRGQSLLPPLAGTVE
jgi:hypothetical protein